MEQIKRANRLYTNDSIFLKKSLSIPVLSDMDGCANGGDVTGEDCGGDNAGCAPAHNRSTRSASANELGDVRQRAADLTPVDFLKRLDELINQSKQAAVRGCQDAEKRVAALEAACTRGASGWRPLPRSSTGQQQREAAHRAVPLTITKLTMNVRDREDDIFEL
ncbi:lysM and putative peptidoglycan-binding domain-containing protein 1 isoform X2 [Scophthalmus maximus]|nr:lysM and putative peptidoglycan-binding domain-containing protein 1 isoform X2 [Scophthalmus maximus]